MPRLSLTFAVIAVALVVGPPAEAARSNPSRQVETAPPDLTGVWMSPFAVAPAGFPIIGGQTQWMPVSEGDPLKVKLPSFATLVAEANEMSKHPPGAPGPGGAPPRVGGKSIGADPHRMGPVLPLTEAGKAQAAKLDPVALEAQRVACYPNNIFLRLPGNPVQIVQNTKAIAFLSEFTPGGRIVFMDGRSQANALPQWNGHSVGHWKGKTLVIDTVAIRGGLFGFDNPMSDDAKLHEEYHLSSDGKQIIGVITFTDPLYYKEPLRKAVYLDSHPELQVFDYQCDEGKADMIETLVEKKSQP